ncbi:MAG: hypothetical protein MJ078_08640, partial [Clostridia bacterium]|nr:hypothetical protein [Clostridia bacterium]
MNVSKRVLCFLLFIFALLLSSCNPYGAVKSTKKEREILATLGAEYDVPYELFRYGYLGQKKLTPDGSFSSLSQSAMREAADVYATFALAKEYGIDPYSKAAD